MRATVRVLGPPCTGCDVACSSEVGPSGFVGKRQCRDPQGPPPLPFSYVHSPA